MSDSKPSQGQDGKFVTGSTMRHVLVMTATSSVGLISIFLVDLADLYFLSLLGEVEVAAAIGYASSILFFATSVGIGLSIAASALASRAVGAGDMRTAKRFVVNALCFAAVVSSVLTIIFWPLLGPCLALLGAEGRAYDLGLSYLQITFASFMPLALTITCVGLLRAVGDANRAMYVTLTGGAVNAILDPIFIFTFGLGVDGAAIASVISRLAAMVVGFYGLGKVHKLLDQLPSWRGLLDDVPSISYIAGPAVLTNIATPIGNAVVTALVAPFGVSAVAGWAIIGRVLPVAFGGLFALSGAIGPILGQNLGAKQYGRMKQALKDALLFNFVYVALVWILLALFSPMLVSIFQAKDEAASLIHIFCDWIAPFFVFNGALFVANAAFNNLNRPLYSTLFNWGRATLGTIPLAYIGGHFFGAAGVIAGSLMGGIVFGTWAVIVCFRLIDQFEQRGPESGSKLPQIAEAISFLAVFPYAGVVLISYQLFGIGNNLYKFPIHVFEPHRQGDVVNG